MGCGSSVNRRIAAEKLEETQDTGPPAVHPAPTTPVQAAAAKEKKAPLSEHHILPDTPPLSSLGDDDFPSKPAKPASTKPILEPEKPTPPPLESGGGGGLAGGGGSLESEGRGGLVGGGGSLESEGGGGPVGGRGCGTDRNGDQWPGGGGGGGVVEGNGVQLPGAGSDGLRRDAEQGCLAGKGERGEKARRSAKEPGGLALATAEPQVRLPKLSAEPLPQLKPNRVSSDRESIDQEALLEQQLVHSGFPGARAAADGVTVRSREGLVPAEKDTAAAEPAKYVKAEAKSEERASTPVELDTTRLTYEQIEEEREARGRQQRRDRGGHSAAPADPGRGVPISEKGSDRGGGGPLRQEASPALAAGKGAASNGEEEEKVEEEEEVGGGERTI